MKRVTPVILAAAGLLVVLDIVGALAEQPLGFPYPPLGVVSLMVYASVGLIGAWRGRISDDEMSRLLEILKAFRLDAIYGADPMPNPAGAYALLGA